MTKPYTVYGWTVSPYTQKVLAYLRYKGIEHKVIAPSILSFAGKISRKVGRPVMPVVRTPEGEWWQDSSEIIDKFENLFPERPVFPESSRQKISANLFELHGDEWLCMCALHYRWRIPENYNFALSEFSRNSWPWWPGLIGKAIGERLGKQMRSYLPKLGVEGDVIHGLERYTVNFLELLDQHLGHHNFLLGGKPCVGDFALFGPLWAHLYRDPGSTFLFDQHPHVRGWLERLLKPQPEFEGEYLSSDEVPVTLEPLLSGILGEQFEYCRSVIGAIDQYMNQHPDAGRVPRIVGEGEFSMGGAKGRRCLLAYVQWMAQRSLDAYQQVSDNEKESVSNWMVDLGGNNFIKTQVNHRMARKNYKEIMLQE
ncbi:glutathione S-transferase family protein [Sansalvadorimonas sp. 2012CJ34-2]|uniref:Glutathione S-transferase family protein n=1 Tax=Parendozoicomonas callyspongiae TaxID=2942213 RepID=A0ABT0PG82_9GAMM|nr:glutathione S-transferase family protein [Sansalvadorimonas sp. 2012CJ34-2]MCL6270377.1 glutathione S-transferase family protein [Sansalvadorimonas sp. 2012CJ34-2]